MFTFTVLTLDRNGRLHHRRDPATYPSLAAATGIATRRYRAANWSGVFNPPEGYAFAWLPTKPPNKRNKSRRILAVHPISADRTEIRHALDAALHNAAVVSAGVLTIQAATLPVNRESA